MEAPAAQQQTAPSPARGAALRGLRSLSASLGGAFRRRTKKAPAAQQQAGLVELRDMSGASNAQHRRSESQVSESQVSSTTADSCATSDAEHPL